MSAWLIAACGVAYAFVFWDKMSSDFWLAVTFLGYAIGNVGLVMKALGH